MIPRFAGCRHKLAWAAVVAVGVMLLPAQVPPAAAQTAIPIVQARPETGSRIRRPLVKVYIDAEKPYAELTPEQRAKFRAHFAGLADADEPPYPEGGLRPVAESLAFVLADGQVGRGRLFVTVKVDEKGVPSSVAVYDVPDARTGREAANVLMKTRYKPGVCAGKPCTSEFPFEARFDD